jgi:peptide deformylase
VLIGDPILRAGTRRVEDVDAARALLDRMAAKLREIDGAGLAAPQVGSDLALLVADAGAGREEPDEERDGGDGGGAPPPIRMMNPRIVAASVEREQGWEGCFSVPGLMGVVERALAIDVEYQDADGRGRTDRFAGHVARVLQHEIDHLNGIFFLDRMASMATLTTVENFERFVARVGARPPETT